MPFRSEAQRKFMWAKHPDIAKRWEKEGKVKGTYSKEAIDYAIKNSKKGGV